MMYGRGRSELRHSSREVDEQRWATGRGVAERRAEAEGNAAQQSTRRAQYPDSVSQARIEPCRPGASTYPTGGSVRSRLPPLKTKLFNGRRPSRC